MTRKSLYLKSLEGPRLSEIRFFLDSVSCCFPCQKKTNSRSEHILTLILVFCVARVRASKLLLALSTGSFKGAPWR